MKKVRICCMLILVLFGVWTLPVGCGSGDGNGGSVTVTSGSNVQPISVNGGPLSDYPNAAFTSVMVCVPGSTTQCQTIDSVLVDTGSSGLRLLSSALTLTLPKQTTDGNPVGECVQFDDGSYIWGSVQTADVKLAGELASSVPIHVLDHNFYTIPTDCSNGGGSENDDLSNLGANGILGIGTAQYDCSVGGTNYCASGSVPLPAAYYECSTSSGCTSAFVSLPQQVQNPVALFSTDNNGVIIELPAVSGLTASLNGSLVFGIGTQSNNGLGSATKFYLDLTNVGNIYTTSNVTGNSTGIPGFIDSGSNGYFFPDTAISIPTCTTNTGFYCPATTTFNVTATNKDYNGNTGNVSFSVGNADSMFSANPNDAVFHTLAGYTTGYFDWGLPFFYGRNVYTAIDTRNTPGPYWAY